MSLAGTKLRGKARGAAGNGLSPGFTPWDLAPATGRSFLWGGANGEGQMDAMTFWGGNHLLQPAEPGYCWGCLRAADECRCGEDGDLAEDETPDELATLRELRARGRELLRELWLDTEGKVAV